MFPQKARIMACLAYFGVLVLLASCALHPPLSEQIIFENANQDTDWSFTFGSGVTGNAFGNRIAEKALPALNYTPKRELGWLRRVGVVPVGVAVSRGRRWALGVSPGVLVGGMGVDGTLQLGGPWYLTVTANMDRNAALIVQKRMALNHGLGWSLGMVARSDVLVIGDNTLDDPDFQFRTFSAGVRLLGSAGSQRFSARGFFTVGYEWLYNVPMARAGIIFSLH